MTADPPRPAITVAAPRAAVMVAPAAPAAVAGLSTTSMTRSHF